MRRELENDGYHSDHWQELVREGVGVQLLELEHRVAAPEWFSGWPGETMPYYEESSVNCRVTARANGGFFK